MDSSSSRGESQTLLWTLQEVAEAAREVPFEAQPERLRRALERAFVSQTIERPDYEAGTSTCSD
jgi:hypothetical protein